jgi:hypothetical protein
MPDPAELRAQYQTALERRGEDRRRLDTVDDLLRKLNVDLDDLATRTAELIDLASETTRADAYREDPAGRRSIKSLRPQQD